jgi:alpha-tubulin suppressor-like RCC1 family protein
VKRLEQRGVSNAKVTVSCDENAVPFQLGQSQQPVGCHCAMNSSVWTWGRAKNYRLGRDMLGRDARSPEAVSGAAFEGLDKSVVAAACGGGHTAVVRTDGALFAFGYSQYGQLGLGDRTDVCLPTQVVLPPARGSGDESGGCEDRETLRQNHVLFVPTRNSAESFAPQVFSARVVDVSCGRYHTLARTSDGAVYTWGGGKNGRLGHGDEKIRLTPSCVRALLSSRAVAITAGYHNNLVLTEQGDVWSWGWGAHGQLGTGDTLDRNAPTIIEGLSGMGIASLTCGDRHSFAITADGAVLGWGSNEFGQVGIGRRGDTFLSPTPISSSSRLCRQAIVIVPLLQTLEHYTRGVAVSTANVAMAHCATHPDHALLRLSVTSPSLLCIAATTLPLL